MAIDEDYSLKESTKEVGQLYPILLAKNGAIIDGTDRRYADPTWRTETLEHIDTIEKIILARAIANWHRRELSPEEKSAHVNDLAELYVTRGLKVTAKNPTPGGGPVNEVIAKLVEVLGVSGQTVTKYLDDSYKQMHRGRPRLIREPRGSAPRGPSAQGLLHDEDHQEEVIQEVGKRIGHTPLLLDVIDEAPLMAEARIRASPGCLCFQCSLEAECSAIDLGAQSARNMVAFHQEGLRRMLAGELFSNVFQADERNTLRVNGLVHSPRGRHHAPEITEAAKLILKSL